MGTKYFIAIAVLLASFNVDMTAQGRPDRQRREKERTTESHKAPQNKPVFEHRRNLRPMKALPAARPVSFRGRNYYYSGGHYYNHFRDNYRVVVPPIGLRIQFLPRGYSRIFIGGILHYYYMGICYRRVNNEYETIEPPVGTIVPDLPEDDIDQLMIDGQTYYRCNNILYRPVNTKYGVQYKVSGRLDD